jgi:pimeloyl-ACP methyl ester carboxylesterase
MTPESSSDGLDARRVRTVEVGGVRTRYWEAGTGEPLVLLHGGHFGTLYALDAWSLNLEPLAGDFRVLAPDRLGQGQTDNPTRDEDYTVSAVLAHLLGFLDAVGVAAAHVVGHSRGGLLAARLAARHPDRVRTLTVVDSATLAPDRPGYDPDAFYARLAVQWPPGPPTRAAVRLEPEAQSFDPAHVGDDFCDRLLAIAQLPKIEVAAERLRALHAAVWAPDLACHRAAALADIERGALRQPVLVVWGANDPSAPLPLAHALYARLAPRAASAELHVFNRAGHYVFRERPAAFNRLLCGFCRQVGEVA